VAGRGHGRRIAGVVLAGAGVVGVGVGLWFGKQVLDLQGEAEDACGGAGTVVPCSGDATRAQALVDDARGKATIADVAMGAGAALVIGGVILYATAPRDAERPAVGVAPLIDGDRVGLSFAGRF
jgi:serine/threonine-protein kinase